MQNNLQRQKISVAWGWGEGFEYVGSIFKIYFVYFKILLVSEWRDEKGNKEILSVTVTVIF